MSDENTTTVNLTISEVDSLLAAITPEDGWNSGWNPYRNNASKALPYEMGIAKLVKAQSRLRLRENLAKLDTDL